MCWSPQTRRLDFAALQRRLHPAARQVAELARTHPANYVVFDVLCLGGEDLRPAPYRHRRQLLEQLLDQVPAPLALTPATTDPATAAQWFRDWPPAVGTEGLVIKGLDQPYRAERGWLRYRRTSTIEALTGAVLGPRTEPTALVLGRYDRAGILRVIGTATVPAALRRAIGAGLYPAGVEHPWPPRLPASWLGQLAAGQPDVPCTRVEPWQVVEIQVDPARDRGRYRHRAKLRRLRPDLQPGDVPFLDE